MKRRKSNYTREAAERARRAMTQRVLDYQPKSVCEVTEIDRRVFCRDNAEDVAAAVFEAKERRRALERMRVEAATVTEAYLREIKQSAKRQGMKVVGGRKGV